MPISTQHGDDGSTDLLFGRRVSKLHPQVIACGDVDELNSHLGLVRAHRPGERTLSIVSRVQSQLFGLMGQLATPQDAQERYAAAGYGLVTAAMVEDLTSDSHSLEAELGRFPGWATPGAYASQPSALLDVARTVCRRAERSVLTAFTPPDTAPAHVVPYLNRLSDVLWLLARWEDVRPQSSIS